MSDELKRTDTQSFCMYKQVTVPQSLPTSATGQGVALHYIYTSSSVKAKVKSQGRILVGQALIFTVYTGVPRSILLETAM